MNKQAYKQVLQNRIDELKNYYKTVDQNDYVERGITLGKINAYYDAVILACELEG